MSKGNIRSNSEITIKVIPKMFVNHNYNMGYFNVGDFVYETHFPDRIGVILDISRHLATVRWQTSNPYSFNRISSLETLEVIYLEKIEGETILNDFGEPGPSGGSQKGRKKNN